METQISEKTTDENIPACLFVNICVFKNTLLHVVSISVTMENVHVHGHIHLQKVS